MTFFVDPGSWNKAPFSSHVSMQREELQIPQGSLLQLAERFHVHSKEDVRHFDRQMWLWELVQLTFIELKLELTRETCNKSLSEQVAYVAESGCSILTPYEIAHLAALWAEQGRGRLFTGRVRTQAEAGSSSSHLAYTPTVIVFYDAGGVLRFARENPGCKRKDLGVLAGIRRRTLPV